MQSTFDSLKKAISHLETLYQIFKDKNNYSENEKISFSRFNENLNNLNTVLDELNLNKQLYGEDSRQMILADLIEYIFLGRGYYAMNGENDREKFIKTILYFVNTLMSFEDMTVSQNLRLKYLELLKENIPSVKDENNFQNLIEFKNKIGLPDSDAPKELNKYFDKMLPKTAGGLWHELLVFIFMLRMDVGYIIPLLLTQRFFSRDKHLVPPDFLIITHDKNLFGIEVGTKKEIQSGSFSFKTTIPSATVDTINSRTSDRCPICKKWIQFCPHVINNYSNFQKNIEKQEIKCIKECSIYYKAQIKNGKCPYTKYSRNRTKTLKHTHHDYADGKHYHYQCVLENVDKNTQEKIKEAEDNSALKTHYPYYQGLEELKE